MSLPRVVRRTVLATLPLLTLLTAADGRAEGLDHRPIVVAPPPPAPAPLRMRRRWYGWQNLVADGVTIVAASATQRPEVFLVGYLAAGPVIHWAHENVWQGFASLGLRAGLPVALGFMGAAVDSGHCSADFGCGFGGFVVGLVVGSVAAIAIDAAVLAYDEVPVAKGDEDARRPRPFRFELVPTFGIAHGGATAGVLMAF
jgi:hypothetical protein